MHGVIGAGVILSVMGGGVFTNVLAAPNAWPTEVLAPLFVCAGQTFSIQLQTGCSCLLVPSRWWLNRRVLLWAITGLATVLLILIPGLGFDRPQPSYASRRPLGDGCIGTSYMCWLDLSPHARPPRSCRWQGR